MTLDEVKQKLEAVGPRARMTIRVRCGEVAVTVRDETSPGWPELLAKTYSDSLELAVEHALERSCQGKRLMVRVLAADALAIVGLVFLFAAWWVHDGSMIDVEKGGSDAPRQDEEPRRQKLAGSAFAVFEEGAAPG